MTSAWIGALETDIKPLTIDVLDVVFDAIPGFGQGFGICVQGLDHVRCFGFIGRHTLSEH